MKHISTKSRPAIRAEISSANSRRPVPHNFQNLIFSWPMLVQRLCELIGLFPVAAFRYAQTLAVVLACVEPNNVLP
jgi:hypothetical protein